jgi:hypoxanthine phosphoribosyltransferase
MASSITQTDIQKYVKYIAKRINNDWINTDEPIVFVCVLNGSFLFFADLVREINFKMEIDFIRVKSYLNREQGDLVVTKDLETKIKGKHVFVVDDIADSGNTLDAIIPFLQVKQPKSIQTVTFLKRYNSKFTPDYYGDEIKHDEWFYGYGMDLDGFLRNLPDLLVVEK